MTLVGLDMNATRILATHGPAGEAPAPLPLDSLHLDLPLVLDLHARRLAAGHAGVGLCRRSPHLAWLDFLAHVGKGREWVAGRHRLDADKALTVVLERLLPSCASAAGLGLLTPIYLDRAQVGRIALLMSKVRGSGRSHLPPLLGSIMAPLAIAQAVHAEQPWSGLGMVIDVDDHALTWTAVVTAGQQACIVGKHVAPHLGLKIWKSKLLDAVSDCCVRHSRRDPRDSGQAEQRLYDQLDAALEACRQEQMVELVAQTERWYQNLILRPEEFRKFCASLVHQAADAMQAFLAGMGEPKPVRTVLLTETAARLPGLSAVMETYAGKQAALVVLPADLPARAAHQLAVRIHQGDLPGGHLETAMPFPQRPPPAVVNPPLKRVIPMWAADR